MGKIVDKTETKIVTLDGVEIIKQVTKVLMPNGKYRYPTVYFTVNLKLIWKKVKVIPSSFK